MFLQAADDNNSVSSHLTSAGDRRKALSCKQQIALYSTASMHAAWQASAMLHELQCTRRQERTAAEASMQQQEGTGHLRVLGMLERSGLSEQSYFWLQASWVSCCRAQHFHCAVLTASEVLDSQYVGKSATP
jgi:hypothetical protein